MTKRQIWLLAPALLCAACATMGRMTPASGDAQAQMAAVVAQKVEQGALKMRFTMVQPRRFPPKMLDYGYMVELRNDSIFSYLPFYGRAYRADFSQKSPLDFASRIREKQTDKGKRGSLVLLVKARAGSVDDYVYRFNIYENGRVYLDVVGTNREQISFTGELADE